MQMFLDKLQWRQSEVGPWLRLLPPQPSWLTQIWHPWMGGMQNDSCSQPAGYQSSLRPGVAGFWGRRDIWPRRRR